MNNLISRRPKFVRGKAACIHVHLSNSRACSFKRYANGLYCSNICDHQEATILINTIAENKSKYSGRNYLQAVAACCLQNVVVNPSYKNFYCIVQNNRIHNCPVTVADIDAAGHIFGPRLPCLKGKITRKKVKQAQLDTVPLSATIVERYQNIELFGYIMRINGLRFYVSMLQCLHFITAPCLIWL